MSSFQRQSACRYPGCSQPALGGDWAGPEVCAGHLALAAPAQRRRMTATLARAAFIETLWADSARYDAIVASGRYLKLVHARQCAEDAVGAATERFMLSIYACAHSMEGRWRQSA